MVMTIREKFADLRF